MKTKTELIEEVGVLNNEIKEWKKNDITIRNDLSGILGSYSYSGGNYGMGKEQNIELLSWLEISSEIGKLLSIKKALNWEVNLMKENDTLKEDVIQLQMRLAEKLHNEN